jgi:hypothetical protein
MMIGTVLREDEGLGSSYSLLDLLSKKKKQETNSHGLFHTIGPPTGSLLNNHWIT